MRCFQRETNVFLDNCVVGVAKQEDSQSSTGCVVLTATCAATPLPKAKGRDTEILEQQRISSCPFFAMVSNGVDTVAPQRSVPLLASG